MRRYVSSASFAIGTLWIAAGVMKVAFGVRVTIPLIPPFGLDHVAVLPSILTGLFWFLVGAVMGRGVMPTDETSQLPNATRPGLLGEHITPPIVAQESRHADLVDIKRE